MPARSLSELARAWDEAKKALAEAGRRHAPDAEMVALDRALDDAFAAYDRQDRRIKLAAARGKGWWI